MNNNAAQTVVEHWLTGLVDALNTGLSGSFSYEADAAEAVSTDQLAEVLAEYPVAIRADIKPEGVVAVLWAESFAGQLAREANPDSVPEGAPVDEAALGALKDLAGTLLPSGAMGLSRAIGEEIEVNNADAVLLASDETGGVAGAFGDSLRLARFQCSAESGPSGAGVFVFSSVLEDLAGDDGGAPSEEPPLVSDAEMKDILKGFTPPSEQESETSARSSADNLDVILDIELTATARLGSVEMPISDILNLGPGSIIEVGQLVDEPIELLVNNKLVARGDVVVVDEKFGLRITEIVSPKERIESLR